MIAQYTDDSALSLDLEEATAEAHRRATVAGRRQRVEVRRGVLFRRYFLIAEVGAEVFSTEPGFGGNS